MPEQDELLDRGRTTANPDERACIYQEPEKYIVDERCLWLFLYDEEHMYRVSRRLNWRATPDEMMLLPHAGTS